MRLELAYKVDLVLELKQDQALELRQEQVKPYNPETLASEPQTSK